jgi:hypothetical protein
MQHVSKICVNTKHPQKYITKTKYTVLNLIVYTVTQFLQYFISYRTSRKSLCNHMNLLPAHRCHVNLHTQGYLVLVQSAGSVMKVQHLVLISYFHVEIMHFVDYRSVLCLKYMELLNAQMHKQH